MKGEAIARRPPNTITFHDAPLPRGALFTIAGVGVGSRGQMVVDGVNPATKRKCKAVKPMLFKAGKSISGTTVKVRQVSGG